MPLNRISCPECGAGLKSAAGFTPGRAVSCPKCEAEFAVEEPEEAEPAPAARKPVRASASAADEYDDRPRKKRRRRDDDDEDDDDRPRKGKKGGYAKSPLRFAILGVLLVVLGVMAYLLVQKKKREKEADAAPVAVASTDDELARPAIPGGGAMMPGGGGVMPGGGPTGRPAATPDAVRVRNNMTIVMLALLNHEAAYGAFPAAAITDKSGKPLLSWRVAILPFIEQEVLYKRFKHDEPWDSPNNKPLLAEMPRTYQSAGGGGGGGGGKTYFRVFIGGSAGFELAKRKKISEIQDGLANTIAVVESGPAVEWTRPDFIPYDPAGPLPTLLPPAGGDTVLVGMFDGSTYYKEWNKISDATRRAAVTGSGGERLGRDW